MKADVFCMAGPFAGHNGTQTQTQAPISLLPPEETGAGMGAIPAEPEVGKRSGLKRLLPARMFPRRQTKQIRERPPIWPVNGAWRGRDVHLNAPAFVGGPWRAQHPQASAGAVVSALGSAAGSGVGFDQRCPQGREEGRLSARAQAAYPEWDPELLL